MRCENWWIYRVEQMQFTRYAKFLKNVEYITMWCGRRYFSPLFEWSTQSGNERANDEITFHIIQILHFILDLFSMPITAAAAASVCINMINAIKSIGYHTTLCIFRWYFGVYFHQSYHYQTTIDAAIYPVYHSAKLPTNPLRCEVNCTAKS